MQSCCAVPSSPEFDDLAQSIHDLRLVFADLPRPEGLPLPGEKLPPMPLAVQQWPDSASGSTPPSRVPSAGRRSHDVPRIEGPQLGAQAESSSDLQVSPDPAIWCQYWQHRVASRIVSF